MIFAIAIVCLTYLGTFVFLYFYNKDIAKERAQLYDRIQARDFIEYKQMSEPTEVKIKEQKENVYVEL